MATKYITVTKDWTLVNSGACMIQKLTKRDVKINTGGDAPNDDSPYAIFKTNTFTYPGSDKVYMRSRDIDITVTVIT